MKNKLSITVLCAIAALFSGCLKNKDKSEGSKSATSTDATAPVKSDEKTIKVASLDTAPPSPSNDDKPRGTNDEAAIKEAEAKEEAIEAKESAEDLKDQAEDLKDEAEDLKDEAEKIEEKADSALAQIADSKKKQKKK